MATKRMTTMMMKSAKWTSNAVDWVASVTTRSKKMMKTTTITTTIGQPRCIRATNKESTIRCHFAKSYASWHRPTRVTHRQPIARQILLRPQHIVRTKKKQIESNRNPTQNNLTQFINFLKWNLRELQLSRFAIVDANESTALDTYRTTEMVALSSVFALHLMKKNKSKSKKNWWLCCEFQNLATNSAPNTIVAILKYKSEQKNRKKKRTFYSTCSDVGRCEPSECRSKRKHIDISARIVDDWVNSLRCLWLRA